MFKKIEIIPSIFSNHKEETKNKLLKENKQIR